MLYDAIYEAQVDIPWNVDPRLVPNNGVSTATNRKYYYRVTRGRALISKIAVPISVQSGNLGVAVYRNNGSAGSAARPSAQAATSGSVACAAPGRQEVALTSSVLVTVGDWFCLWADNTTIRFEGTVMTVLGMDGLAAFEDIAGVAPDPATPANTAMGRCFPLVGVV